jgi:hypothetical protein
MLKIIKHFCQQGKTSDPQPAKEEEGEFKK